MVNQERFARLPAEQRRGEQSFDESEKLAHSSRSD
jgi:hypothetical protein